MAWWTLSAGISNLSRRTRLEIWPIRPRVLAMTSAGANANVQWAGCRRPGVFIVSWAVTTSRDISGTID